MSNKIKLVILIFLLSSFLSVSCYAKDGLEDGLNEMWEELGIANGNNRKGNSQSAPSKTGKEQPTKGGGGKKCEDCKKKVGDEIIKCEKEKQDLKQKCDKEKSVLSGNVAKLEKEKGEQEKKIAALTKEKQELTRGKQNLEGDIKNLTEDSKKLRESMNALQDKIATSSGDDFLKNENRELREKVATLNADLEDKEQKLSTLHQKVKKLQDDSQTRAKYRGEAESQGNPIYWFIIALALGLGTGLGFGLGLGAGLGVMYCKYNKGARK